MTPPLYAAVPGTISLIERIQKYDRTWYAVIDLANAFFSILIDSKQWELFAFTWQGQQYTFTCLLQGYLQSPTICHRIVAEHLYELELPAIQLTHRIDDFMIQVKTIEEVEKSLTLLIEHMKSKEWEINPAKIQGPA